MQLAVANTILKQLGGGRFLAMTGARNLVGSANDLSFRITRARDGINVVTIRLDPSDTYTVTFSRLRGTKMTTIRTLSDIYNDQLQKVFTDITGLATHL